MFYTYILKSQKDFELYVGSTNDLRRRFREHNQGYVESTKLRRPFKLVYYEAYASEYDARERERNLKLRSKARTVLIRRIKKSVEEG